MKEHGMSERQACKLVEMDRRTYRYEPPSDRNAQLREELLALARQKPW
jgi:putative transposase